VNPAALFLALGLWRSDHDEDLDASVLTSKWGFRLVMAFLVGWLLLMVFCITSMLGVEYW
jgi:hypothetical protein